MATKSIFITDAASGMGREGVKLFHGHGWRVGAIVKELPGLTEQR
jgi:NAD(P)-dependent dehydrogenase (short-subunit alcohol dehydrogenase family)